MKQKITLVLAILCSLYSFGQTVGTIFPSGGLYFKITSASTVEVSEGNQNFVGVANIPSTALDAGITYEVTSIGIHAFKQSPTLTSVIIPNSVNNIKSEAFLSCLSLNSITIGNSVTTIGDRAFQYCSGLTAVIIGSSVTTIGSGAFHGCVNLKSITIPNSVTNIGQEAFYFCSGLTAVNIGNSIMNIGEGTFKNCVKLTSINIPSSVVSMGYGAFNNCSSLTSVTVNWTTPLTINANVFEGFNLATKILNIPAGTETAYKNALVWKEFGSILEPVVPPVLNQIFTASGINYIVIKATLPYEVAVGSNKTFVGVATIPTTVSNSGNSFAVNSIDAGAFVNCTGLTSVAIPYAVTSIRTAAFAGCTGLTSINIPNSVTSIMNQAFQDCTSLTSISIPNSITTIDMAAFSGCSGLKSVTMPNSVTSIGYGSFSSCTSLTSISIPNSVTSIDNLAFDFCRGLTSITIPYSVTSIGEGAFRFCDGLTSFTVNWTSPLTINRNVFEVLTLSKVTLNVPSGTSAAYNVANVWKDFKIVETTLSNIDFAINNKIHFYSNQAKSHINFSQEINTLEVFDIVGKKVKSFHIPSTIFDVSTLEKGVYVLKGNTKEGININEKMIKN